MTTAEIVMGVVVLGTAAALSWYLYAPKRQASDGYQAAVVPLANIMDVGFLAMTPVIVVLVGVDAPLFMALLVGLALLMGRVMAYNIRHFEPVIGTSDPLNGIEGFSRWALVAASMVNIAYYLQLVAVLVLIPFGVQNETLTTWIAIGIAALIAVVGYFFGLAKLDAVGQRTTAFNLATVGATLAGFLAFNVWMLATGQWDLPEYNPPDDLDRWRKLIGFFAIVQGFEASRYLSTRYSADLRIRTMRLAQIISGLVFVVLIAASLILFVQARPPMDGTAIFRIGLLVTPFLPYLILAAALGSQVSAAINAVSSRSDLLLEATHNRIPRKYTYPLLIVPVSLVALFTNVVEAIAFASRVFAAYFTLQCIIAAVLAYRRPSWWRVAGIAGVGILMATIAIFGMSV